MKVFLPAVEKRRKELGVSVDDGACLLLLDGHSSRAEPDAMQALLDANVTVRTIPAHSSHVCQPLDRGVFAAFKEWIRLKRRNTYRLNVPEKRQALLKLAYEAWYHAAFPGTVAKAWRASGHWPLNRTIVLSDPTLVADNPTPACSTSTRSGISLSNQILTSPAALAAIEEQSEKRKQRAHRAEQAAARKRSKQLSSSEVTQRMFVDSTGKVQGCIVIPVDSDEE